MSEAKEITMESLAGHMAALRATPSWLILLNYLAQEREKIIDEGKKSRASEKGVKMWAVIEGFDRAVAMPEKLQALAKSAVEQTEEIED